MAVVADLIVKACIEFYKSLPKTGKPGPAEWTVVSAVVGDFDGDPKVVAMGTGSRCLGRSMLSPRGDVLNDSHAEVVARRAFLMYLYSEIAKLNETNASEVFLRETGDGFGVRVKNGVRFHFVTSMSPCGDASIMPKDESGFGDSDYGYCLDNRGLLHEGNILKRTYSVEDFISKKSKTEILDKTNVLGGLEKNEQGKKDIYRTGAKCLPSSSIQDPHLPGVLYHRVGAVRTKPGRGDPTLSLSCSDKIARWNSVGWQGALLAFFLKEPLFMSSIICGGGCPFSLDAFNRAVNVRMNKTEPVPIHQSSLPFPDIKTAGKKPNPSSIIWYRGSNKDPEVSINGRKQGTTKKNINKKSARVCICKKELFLMFGKVVSSSPGSEKFLENVLRVKSLKEITYGGLKSKAESYQNSWKNVKEGCFKVWADKSKNLLEFGLEDDE